MLTILRSKKVNWVWCTSLFFIIILGSIFFHSFNRSFYHTQYTKLNTAQTIGISDSELDTATGVLLDYIVDHRDDLDYKLESGEPMFNQREIDHMVDVKNLYLGAKSIFILSIIVFLAITLYFLIKLKFNEFLFTFKQSFRSSFMIFGLVLGLIGIYALVDFSGFWTNFHHLFFRNDLWLLNPATDRLIQMVPLPFFTQLVFRILFSIMLLVILLTLLSLVNINKNPSTVHIVLYEPEIPQNTGNIMRTAMATGAHLHLIEPLGFVYDEKRVRRSGLDYIDQLELTMHTDWQEFLETVDGDLYFVTRYGEKSHSDFNYPTKNKNIYLVFGKESTGIPLDILSSHLDTCMRLPMVKEARSLNLANSVAIVVYEVMRQLDYQDLSLVETQKGADWLRQHQ